MNGKKRPFLYHRRLVMLMSVDWEMQFLAYIKFAPEFVTGHLIFIAYKKEVAREKKGPRYSLCRCKAHITSRCKLKNNDSFFRWGIFITPLNKIMLKRDKAAPPHTRNCASRTIIIKQNRHMCKICNV
jgi:hypothetical protein